MNRRPHACEQHATFHTTVPSMNIVIVPTKYAAMKFVPHNLFMVWGIFTNCVLSHTPCSKCMHACMKCSYQLNSPTDDEYLSQLVTMKDSKFQNPKSFHMIYEFEFDKTGLKHHLPNHGITVTVILYS